MASIRPSFVDLIMHGNPRVLTILQNYPSLLTTGLGEAAGRTDPLFHTAAYFRQVDLLLQMFEVVDELIKQNKLAPALMEQNMIARNNNGQGILHLVASSGTPALMDYCIRYGADLTQENSLSQTVAAIAAGSSRLDILNHLVKLGVNINAPSSNGSTPLHFFRWYEMSNETAMFLLEQGANINAGDKSQATALSKILSNAVIGVYLNNTEVQKAIFLLEHGAKLKNFSLEGLETFDKLLAAQSRDLFKLNDTHGRNGSVIIHGYDVPFQDIQYLRALIKELIEDFTEAKILYVDAAANGNVNACIKLSNHYELNQNWKEAIDWYMSALATKKISLDRGIYLAFELISQNGFESEIYYRELIQMILANIDKYHVSANNRLLLAHVISRLRTEIDGIPADMRMQKALEFTLTGYKQAQREGDVEVIYEAGEDILNFMNLVLQRATSGEKEYLSSLASPEVRDISYYRKLCLQLANVTSTEGSPKFNPLRASEWYELANLLVDKKSQDPSNLHELKRAIQAGLNEEKSNISDLGFFKPAGAASAAASEHKKPPKLG